MVLTTKATCMEPSAKEELHDLTKTFKAQFNDAAVMIDNSKGRSTLLISVSDEDQDTAARSASAIESAVRAEFARREKQRTAYRETYSPRSTVENATAQEEPVDHYHYDVLVVVGE